VPTPLLAIELWWGLTAFGPDFHVEIRGIRRRYSASRPISRHVITQPMVFFSGKCVCSYTTWCLYYSEERTRSFTSCEPLRSPLPLSQTASASSQSSLLPSERQGTSLTFGKPKMVLNARNVLFTVRVTSTIIPLGTQFSSACARFHDSYARLC
jgi:hypothetical protein